jgi:hypothetical protein
MGVPQPPVALENICSVIYNNTLYTYSSNAFQALQLSPGATWQTLEQGVSVTGARCAGSTPSDPKEAAFFVIGGLAKSDGYQGMQKYYYSTGKWETISPSAPVTQQRLWHDTAYLKASNSFLVYAGSQDGSKQASTQTFTISASAPYRVTAYTSIAPPTIKPILLPWSDSEVVLIGGSVTNRQVMLFSAEKAWVDSGASLEKPLEKDTGCIQAALIKGDDQSKNLYTFDMTVSPNIVTRVVLADGQGAPIQNSPALTQRSTETQLERKDSLTEASWPEYNSTFVSTTKRTDFSLADDSKGLVVVAGGSTDDVLCMFDGRKNEWQNASAKFVDSGVQAADVPIAADPQPTTTAAISTIAFKPTSTSTTSSASQTSASTQIPTAAAAASSDTGSNNSNLNSILGAVLGVIFGVGLLLGIVLFCMRRRKKRQAHLEAGHNRRASGVSSKEKGGVGYASNSLPHSQKEGTYRGHQSQGSANSFSSIAILMGRSNKQAPPNSPSGSRSPKRISASSVFNRAFKSSISKPIPQTQASMAAISSFQHPSPPPSREEKGVSFAANTVEPRPRVSNVGPGQDRQGNARRSSGWNRYWSGGSASLNMLGLPNNGGPGAPSRRTTVGSEDSSAYSDVSHHRITQDSATVPPLNIYDQPRASLSKVRSGSPTVAQYGSKIKEGMSGRIERPVTRDSDASGYSSGIPASVHDAWDPTSMGSTWGAAGGKTSSAFTSAAPSTRQPSIAPSGVSRQPQLTLAATSSDMSWLNIGDFGGRPAT